MHDRKMVLNSVEVLLVVKVIEDDWKMEKTRRSFLLSTIMADLIQL